MGQPATSNHRAMNLIERLTRDECVPAREWHLSYYVFPCGLSIADKLAAMRLETMAVDEAVRIHADHHQFHQSKTGDWNISLTDVRDGNFRWYKGECYHYEKRAV